MDNTTPTPDENSPQPYAQGVSNPPDNGNVEDTGTNANTDNTADIQAAQQGQPQSDPAAQGQPNQPMQAGQSAMPPNQPGQPQQPAQPAQAQSHPAVQRAGLLNEIATALAGGPRYKTTIDPNTGESSRASVPISKGQIGLAIALEALSGGLAGLGEKGTNATGKAAAAGLQQGKQIAAQRQQEQQQQDQQANIDFAHHAQVLQTNMRLYNNAQQASRADFDTNEKYVGQFADAANKLLTDYPSAVQGVVDEADLQKFHIAKDTAIPYKTVPRIDPSTGEQVKNEMGVPQWDHQYLVVDPKFKADDILTDEDKATAAKYHLPGFVNGKGEATKLPQSLPMKLSMYANLKSQIGALQLAESDVNGFYDTVNKSSTQPTFNLKAPDMKDSATQSLIDDAAKRNGVDPALARAVAIQESGGNSDAKSPKGAVGVMQLMPDTAKAMGVQDSTNAAQNIEGGVKYLKTLLDKYNGDPKLALAAYNAGPGNVTDSVPNIPETQNYVNSISKMIGLDGQSGTVSSTPKFTPVDLVKAVQSDPQLPKAITAFQAMFNRTGSYGQAINELAKSDPQSAGKISQLYGGRTAIDTYDTQKQLDKLQDQEDIKANTEIKKQAAERAAKAGEQAADHEATAQAIAGDPNDPGSGDITTLAEIISQKTGAREPIYRRAKEINPNFSPANAELKVHVWKDFTTDQGKSSQQVKSFNTFLQHVGGAIDANDQWRRTGGGEQLNKPLSWWAKNASGDPALSQLQASIEPVKSEFLTFLSNNHALTEHDKSTGDNILSWNMSPAVLEDQLKKFALTASDRAVEVDHQWTRVFGNGHHFPGMISPEAIEALGKMTNADGSNPAADRIKDLDTGGTVLGSSTGRGVPGQTVSQALGRNSQPQQQPLPQGNGQKLDTQTAQLFMKQANNDPAKARQLATQNQWSF